MSQQVLPETGREWQRRATRSKVDNRTIRNLELNSASKFQFPQYLSLWVLLNGHSRSFFKPEEFGLGAWVDEAKQKLADYESWETYCSSFNGTSTEKIPEGTFDLARFYQKQVMQTDERDCDFDLVSPVSNRTRGKERFREQQRTRDEELMQRNMGRLEIGSQATPRRPTGPVNPSTPVKQIDRVNPITPVNQIGPVNRSISGDTSTPSRPSPPGSPGGEEYIGEERPRTKDEQIVNTALIDFLNAFIIHLTGPYVQWTLHRMPFRAIFTEKSKFEARTVGYLEDRSHNIHAIVEVKPFRRIMARRRIAMQEAAQIVAWIMTNPDNDRTFTNGR